jgi:hypothetical protein
MQREIITPRILEDFFEICFDNIVSLIKSNREMLESYAELILIPSKSEKRIDDFYFYAPERIRYVSESIGAFLTNFFLKLRPIEGIYPLYRHRFNIEKRIKSFWKKQVESYLIYPDIVFLSEYRTIEEILFISYIPLIGGMLYAYQLLNHFKEIKLLKKLTPHRNIKHLLIFSYRADFENVAWNNLLPYRAVPFKFKELIAKDKYIDFQTGILYRLFKYTDEEINFENLNRIKFVVEQDRSKLIDTKTKQILGEIRIKR